ncbi:hypothetical protein [Streptomyces sp. NPDC088348]|uniref:hypothetical protein n=1 Tax=Streptomyces sp. NPDC088348 TaxID=3365853 RepID=UPI00380DC719
MSVSTPTTPPAPPPPRMRVASGTIAFTNVAGTYPEYYEKATRIVQLLTAHTAVTRYLNGRACTITLEKCVKETPADVTDKGKEGVHVSLASSYFENDGIGHIAGMLSHEFAIHRSRRASRACGRRRASGACPCRCPVSKARRGEGRSGSPR